MYTPNSLDQTLTQAIIPYNQAYAEMILAYVTPACLVFNTYAPIEKGGGFPSGKQNRNLQNYSHNERSPLTPHTHGRPTDPLTQPQSSRIKNVPLSSP